MKISNFFFWTFSDFLLGFVLAFGAIIRHYSDLWTMRSLYFNLITYSMYLSIYIQCKIDIFFLTCEIKVCITNTFRFRHWSYTIGAGTCACWRSGDGETRKLYFCWSSVFSTCTSIHCISNNGKISSYA